MKTEDLSIRTKYHVEKYNNKNYMGAIKMVSKDIDKLDYAESTRIGAFVHILLIGLMYGVILKIVMLLHDIGKPSTKQMVDGVGKFHGHPAVSAEISTNILERLHFERRFINEALYLIKTHDNDLYASKSACKRFIMNSSIETAKKFMAVRKADIDAQSVFNRAKKHGQLDSIANFINIIESEASVLDRSKMAIKGGDMLAIGLKGPSIKLVLGQILDEIVDETLKNDKDVLIKRAREIAVSLDLI